MQDNALGVALWAARYGLGVLGGYLVSRGYLDDATWQTVAGAVMSLIGAGWSIVARQRALATPPR